jgi:hypothetical protein
MSEISPDNGRQKDINQTRSNYYTRKLSGSVLP